MAVSPPSQLPRVCLRPRTNPTTAVLQSNTQHHRLAEKTTIYTTTPDICVLCHRGDIFMVEILLVDFDRKKFGGKITDTQKEGLDNTAWF